MQVLIRACALVMPQSLPPRPSGRTVKFSLQCYMHRLSERRSGFRAFSIYPPRVERQSGRSLSQSFLSRIQTRSFSSHPDIPFDNLRERCGEGEPGVTGRLTEKNYPFGCTRLYGIIEGRDRETAELRARRRCALRVGMRAAARRAIKSRTKSTTLSQGRHRSAIIVSYDIFIKFFFVTIFKLLYLILFF